MSTTAVSIATALTMGTDGLAGHAGAQADGFANADHPFDFDDAFGLSADEVRNLGPDRLTDFDLLRLNARFETSSAEEIIAWAVATFGPRLCLTTSLTDAVLLDIAWRVDPSVEIVFLDTQYHFPETLATLETVKERYHPNLRVLTPAFEPDDLWQIDTDLCCKRRKVEQLDGVLDEKDAWMTGLRRSDAPTRANTPIVTRDGRGLIKISPIATWTDAQVDDYIARHDVPVNPLIALGYPSVGCWPCTQTVAEGDDPRSGRWSGSGKTECGLHL